VASLPSPINGDAGLMFVVFSNASLPYIPNESLYFSYLFSSSILFCIFYAGVPPAWLPAITDHGNAGIIFSIFISTHFPLSPFLSLPWEPGAKFFVAFYLS
jgi:hypothetical protein